MMTPQPQSSLAAVTSSNEPSHLRAVAWVENEEWQGLFDRAPLHVREEVAKIVHEHTAALATTFYDTLLREERARPYLSHEQVNERLHSSMQRWLRTMFVVPAASITTMVELQQHVGKVHARIQLPITLVSRGARILKDAISQHLRATHLDREGLSLAQQFVGGMFDLALEVMSTTYLRDARRDVRAGEAYRLYSLGQNVAAERERQRAALLDWAQRVLLQMHLNGGKGSLPTLRRSEFGLWMYHKGGASFDGSTELSHIRQTMEELDSQIVPTLLSAARAADTATVMKTAQRFHEGVDHIQFLLTRLFERMGEVESGRDPLTQLLNRRFVSTVLAREIALARQEAGQFGVLMIDLDFFKRVNDRHGHEGGDAVLRQMAELLLQNCRSGDYVFRYGGEEFMVVLVDINPALFHELAEKLRVAVAEHSFRLPGGSSATLTTSVGGAMFDGHPDPQRLIQLADQRLYAAKQGGRNQCRLD